MKEKKEKKEAKLDIGDFIDIEQIQKDIKSWGTVRSNAKIILNFGIGFIAGFLFGGGDLLFSAIIVMISLYMAMTSSGTYISDYFLDLIQGLFRSNPEKELKVAQAKYTKNKVR